MTGKWDMNVPRLGDPVDIRPHKSSHFGIMTDFFNLCDSQG